MILGLVAKRQLFEQCEIWQQCDGTANAGICRKNTNHSFCFCNDGYVQDKGTCVKGSFYLS